MSEGYNGLKAFAFTAGITILIFIILYVARRYNPGLFGQESFSHNSWYFRGSNVPADARPDGARQPVGEKPRMWDVRIASWYPLCSRRGSLSRRLALGEGGDGKLGVGRAGIDEDGPRYGEFLVSCINLMSCAWGSDHCKPQPLSADKVSDSDTATSSPQVKPGRRVQCTPSTQIRISTIILMPALPPRPVFLPSTSSLTPFSNNTGDCVNFPREYVLGTSYTPYTPDD